MGIGLPIPIMTITDYIIDILKKYKHTKFDIGDQPIGILSNFTGRRYQSTYMIFSYSKHSGSKIDYKNTYKRVKRLENLGFIEPVKAGEVKEEDARHGAKYYRISETGMFQLFLQHSMDFTLFDILQINGDYSIFKALLYPIFDKETFKALNSVDRTQITIENIFEESTVKKWIIIDIYQYLRDCCIEINRIIMFMNENNKDLNYIESPGGRGFVEGISVRINLLRDSLALNLLGLFDGHKNKDWQNALTILAHDDKFMKVVDNLHKDFEKCFGIAMHLGGRS